MTHNRRSRFLVAAASLLGVTALAATMATSASAGVTPSPSPTVTTPAPTPRPVLHFHPQAFIAHSNTADPGGTVALFGVINGLGTGNFANGPADVWSLTGPARTLHVFHSPVGPLVRNPFTCTASLDQRGRWALVGPRVFAFGSYRLHEVAILGRGLFGRCLPRVVRWSDVQVIGVGQGARLPRFALAPHLSPSLTPVS